MTERDKMLGGEPYDASDPELVAGRVRARRLTQQLSSLDPADHDGTSGCSASCSAISGAGSWVEAPFHCDYGAQIRLGARVFVNMACVFLDAAAITLGDDVQLGPGVQLLTSDHPRDAAQRAAVLESALPISIGARAWLGGGVIVLPGVDIGRGRRHRRRQRRDAFGSSGRHCRRESVPGDRSRGRAAERMPA